jgi:hypothetical protein
VRCEKKVIGEVICPLELNGKEKLTWQTLVAILA